MSEPVCGILDRLYGVIEARRRSPEADSYVAALLGDRARLEGKLHEELGELIEAAREGDPAHTRHEAADLLFHVWVLLGAVELPPREVYAELERRFGQGGFAEKAAREKAARGEGTS